MFSIFSWNVLTFCFLVKHALSANRWHFPRARDRGSPMTVVDIFQIPEITYFIRLFLVRGTFFLFFGKAISLIKCGNNGRNCLKPELVSSRRLLQFQTSKLTWPCRWSHSDIPEDLLVTDFTHKEKRRRRSHEKWSCGLNCRRSWWMKPVYLVPAGVPFSSEL